jgi:hypothetical protein
MKIYVLAFWVVMLYSDAEYQHSEDHAASIFRQELMAQIQAGSIRGIESVQAKWKWGRVVIVVVVGNKVMAKIGNRLGW